MRKLLLSLMFALLALPAFATDQWSTAIPLSASNVSDFPAQALSNNNALDRLVSYYREGQTIVYKDASTITVGAGEVSCTNSSTGVHVFRQNASSTDVTFANLDTGAEAPSTTYYVYANCDADATTNTYKISLNATTPTGVTSFRLLGSFYNNSASSISSVSNETDNKKVGSCSSKSPNVIYQALTDGFVTSSMGSDNNSGSKTLYAYVGAENPPTTQVAISGGDPVAGGSWNSVSFPVKAGNYYEIVNPGYDGGTCFFSLN